MLSSRRDCAWNAQIKDLIKVGEYKHAFAIFQKMRKNLVVIEIYTYVALIKACAKLRDLERGEEFHDEVCEKGLEKELLVGSTLISMYASCGLLTKAQKMFHKLPVQDAVIWNTLISGYVQHEQSEEALRCVYRMQLEGFCCDNVTYILSLKACGTIGAVHRGQELHSGIVIQNYLERDFKVGNALVDMYTKCGLFLKAKEVLRKLPAQDTVSWNALISGYAKQGLAEEALHCYEQMHLEGVFPDAITMASSLKACGCIIALGTGLRIHVEVSGKGIWDRDIILGNALVDMYAKCGMLQNALVLFNKLTCKDAVSWTVLITGYAQHGYGEDALSCFKLMQMHGISPDAVTLLCCLKACSTTGAVDIGCEIHAEIARRGLMERNLIGNALIDMYAKCSLLCNAQEVFETYSMRDVVSWNALIGGCAQHGYGVEALDYFQQMELEGIFPDAVTFVCALNACGIEGAICIGLKIHAEAARKGLSRNSVLGNALVDMYAKCGAFVKAWGVFDSLSAHNIATWNSLIAGYVKHHLPEEVIDCFMCIERDGGVVPDAATYVCALKACGVLRAACKGVELHTEICRRGFHESDVVIGNVLVDMYCNCGLLGVAREVFENLPFLDVITWTVLAAGYARHGLNEEALCVFKEMQHEGFAPSMVTHVCMLSACGNLGALEMGIEIHAEMARKGLLEQDLTAGNALLDMYASCGLIANAHETFCGLGIRSIISWSSLIAGYAQIGATSRVYGVLKEMETEDETPNLVTFVSILNACSHTGQVDEGQVYFGAMSECFSVIPSLEHHNCLLDLFSRAGQLDKAVWVLRTMPFIPNVIVWHIMLGACKKWHDQELGREVFDNAMRLDKRDGAALVCMWNIVAGATMQ
ncbi:hypothetical protein GOP47_0030453 [Adiantum capillus-veneris]|nr:hypothetical protein GOP47_0030453 [Adiantum capillus-veneris]